MVTKLATGVIYHDGIPSMTLLSLRLLISRDKIKPLYLYYKNAYDHKVWLAGDLPKLLPIKPYHHVIPYSCKITRQTLYLHFYNAFNHKIWQDGEISEQFLPIESHDHIITRSLDQLKSLTSTTVSSTFYIYVYV